MRPSTPPETEKINLAGLTNITTLMSHIANKPTHIGGAYRM